MTSGKLLKKYFWFLRAFQSGPISRAEISRRWLSSPLNDDKKALARSTFYHMKNELEELFDVSIACDKKEGWYIEQSFREDEEFRKWLLNSLAVESSLEDYANMHGRIMYESIPGGIQHLQTVVDAMQHCYRIIIRYGSFVHEPREFIFAPYAVRIYKQRWYAIGESSDHPGEIRTYAFDRFMQVSTTNSTYENKQKFNRNSFDNQGSIVYNIVNPHRDTEGLSSFPVNACALPVAPYPMVYGMGMNSSETTTICTKPFVSIDIMAHEFSHLVTNNNGNGGLEYQGESGALNESFSDIMGISVKQYAMGSNDWLIGNNVMIYLSNMRSMKNPKNSNDGINGALSGPQPDTYGGQYWSDPADISNDNGGVHTNSGVQNYWFYLLSEGGTGTNDLNNQYNVAGIGIDKAAQIAYRNLIYYLMPEATFEDARNGSIMAATDLYGRNSHEVQAVVNAWYAVGVGDNLLPTALDRVSDASYANKYIRNGQILIQRGENIYTIQGQKLQ